MALIFDGSKAEWESGNKKDISEVPHGIKRTGKRWTKKGVCFREACKAIRLAANHCKQIKSIAVPENCLETQESLDEQALWRDGLAKTLHSENVDVFRALFGHDTVLHKSHVADSWPKLTAQQQRSAQGNLEFHENILVKKIIENYLDPEWNEWQEIISITFQTFRYHEKTDLRIDPNWPVNTCNLTWVNNRIRDPEKDRRREWWRNFHREGLLSRFKTTRLTRLAIIFKAMMQEKDPNTSAIAPYSSLYDQDGMRESVAWLKERSIASETPQDREFLGRPECVVSVCKNLAALKNLYCIFVLVSEDGNPDSLYATLNPEQEAVLVKKRITINGLRIVGNAIAESSVQPPQYLADQYLYSNIVQQANIAEYRASNVRPGPSGIEFQSAFLEVCVHASAKRVLRLPLITDFNMEDHVFGGDDELDFWEKMRLEFKDGGLHEAADDVCGDKVSEKWDLRNSQFWTEVWSRKGDLKMYVPCRTRTDTSASSLLGKRLPAEQPKGTTDQVVQP